MTIFTDKAKKYVPRLQVDLQISREQACGIFGNLGTETGGFTALQEKKPLVAGSRGGYGWMQWTGPRRRKYEAWCQQNMFDPAADETNYKYLVKETKTDEAASLVALRQTRTADAAAQSFMQKNLRPGVPHLENRIRWAKEAEVATRVAASQAPAEGAQNTSTGVGTAVAAGGLMYYFQEHWFAILCGAAAFAGVVWFAIHRYHRHQEDIKIEQEISQLPVKKVKKPKTKTAANAAKKGKKNGQSK